MIWYFALLFILQRIAAKNFGNIIRFGEIDYNKDGRITMKELEQWQESNTINTDKNLKDLFNANDKNHDKVLTIAEFVPMALVLTKRPVSQSEQFFKWIDLNNDGMITPDEVLESSKAKIHKEMIEEAFQMADSNNDGTITFKEFSSIIDANPSVEKPKTQAEQNREMAQQMMVLIDQNNDYKLTVQEVHSFANTNAQVSEEEILQTFAFLDTNRDGYLSFNELITLPDKMVELVHFKEPPPVIIE